MISIRIFLVVALLATITLTVFLSALHGYRASLFEAQMLFDAKLADMARLLASGGTNQPRMTGATNSHQFVYQVWQDGKLIQHTGDVPQTPIARFEAGYHDTNFGKRRWHTYVLSDAETSRWIMTAEPVDVRSELAENIILKSVVPVVVALPVAGLLIWVVVGYGLSPLRRLAARLQIKRSDDLGPLPDEAQPKELVQVVTSINDLLVRLEAAFAREKRFAADAAHELRTPVSAMKIHLHNIARELPDGNPDLVQLETTASRMQNLVEQLLSLYRTAPDRLPVKAERIDLHALVQEFISREFSQYETHELQLELDGDGAFVLGDKFAIETLLKNLLDNACKYTPEGGAVRISIQVRDSRVILRVQDSGPGIPQTEYGRVFDRFYRIGGDRHASGVIGCGLGLSIVQHVAELHHADIELGATDFGGGLSVSVSFPRFAATEDRRRHV